MFDFPQQMITQWISSWVGKATQSHFPGSRLMAKEFTRFYHINLTEAKEDPTYYSNIHRIFTRQLKPNLRTIHNDPNSVVSPCDGEISEFGQILLHQKLKIKKTHDCVVV